MAMTPEELIEAWKTETEALRKFFGAQPKMPGWGTHHTEAFCGFKRAGMALQKFRAYELELLGRYGRGRYHSDDVEPLEFYAHAFYYFAWRFLKVLHLTKARQSDGQQYQPFDGLKAKGVRFCRNQMLEHSDKPDGVPDLVSQFLSLKGWVMALDKVDERNEPLDPGLWANAEQLLTNLRRRMTMAVEAQAQKVDN
jgi:hypothetical protein